MINRSCDLWSRAALAAALFVFAAPASSAGTTAVHTNQSYVEEMLNQPDFAIDDVKAVFGLVFDSLPERVKVYPTENYYYFYFHHRGIKYAGNLRFDIEDRDSGVVHFNYFKDFTLWQRDEGDFNAVLGAKDGVTVKKEGPLAYSVAANGRRVLFELNDLSAVKPPEGAVRKEETYIGPIFDESGIRFFLVFNPELRIFHYILDETVAVADQFNAVPGAEGLSVGIRTGFAFYQDRFAKRKILVAISQSNTAVNNYLDGPFDQLPDNFIVGDTLKDAILAASPEMEGEMDRFGNSPDGETRYLIAPYMQYEDVGELGMIASCAAEEQPPIYYNCFSFVGAGESDSEEETGAEEPPPDDANP